jgi:hypothetical protein
MKPNPMAQWEALTEDERHAAAVAAMPALAEAGRRIHDAMAGISAALVPFAEHMRVVTAALGDNKDEAPGAVWSQLMADIDELTDLADHQHCEKPYGEPVGFDEPEQRPRGLARLIRRRAAA